MKKGFAPIVVLIIFTLVAVGGGTYYLKNLPKPTEEPQEKQSSPLPTSATYESSPNPTTKIKNPSPTSTPSPSELDIKTSSWKSFSGKYATFKYPPTWPVKSQGANPGGSTVYDLIEFKPLDASFIYMGDSNLTLDYIKSYTLIDIISSTGIKVGGRDALAVRTNRFGPYEYLILVPGSEKVGNFTIHAAFPASLEIKTRENYIEEINTLSETIKFLK